MHSLAALGEYSADLETAGCSRRSGRQRHEDSASRTRHVCAMRFERRAKRTVYRNPWIAFEAHDIVHPNGTPGEHGLVISPPASAVVVYDDGIISLTRQARFAIDRVVLEVIKGGSEPGESALDAAKRETLEEAGVEADRWDSLGIVYELPSIVQHSVAVFLARDLHYVAPQLEAIESIEIVRLPLSAALAAIYDGEIDDAVTGLAVLRAARLIEGERA